MQIHFILSHLDMIKIATYCQVASDMDSHRQGLVSITHKECKYEKINPKIIESESDKRNQRKNETA